MPDMNWDTNEAINWFLNDEWLYLQRNKPAWMLKELWSSEVPTKDVDVQEVDWDQVENFFDEED